MRSMASNICFKALTVVLTAVSFMGKAYTQTPVPSLRPVTATYSIETGSSHLADTYLSPIKYSGWSAAFSYERWQAMKFSPEKWVMQLSVRAELDRAVNPAKNSAIWNAGMRGSWSMMRRYRLPVERLTAGIGPMTDLHFGCMYLPRNGNNPAQAHAAFTVGIAAFLTYGLHIGRLPVTIGYQPSLPLVGAFFVPEYGELYYEISLGNHPNSVHAAWPASYRAIYNLITSDLHLGSTTLRLGYRFDLISSQANHITSRHITHMAVIGIGGEWLSVAQRRPLTDTSRIISAYY